MSEWCIGNPQAGETCCNQPVLCGACVLKRLAAAEAEVERLKGHLETLVDAVDSQLTTNEAVLVWNYCDEKVIRAALEDKP